MLTNGQIKDGSSTDQRVGGWENWWNRLNTWAKVNINEYV